MILNVINACTICNTNLYIVINKNNYTLKNYIKKLNRNIRILEPVKELFIDTISTALNIEGDCIIVCGDLTNLNNEDIKRFVDCSYKNALCRYKNCWGNIISSPDGKLIRRSDIGDCIMKISHNDKKNYLSHYDRSINYFNKFYPGTKKNYSTWNDIGTHLDYSFFFEIWSNPKKNHYGNKGTIYFDKDIYNDND